MLSPKHINKLLSMNYDTKIINAYGPTENTVITTTFEINRKFENSIPIGKPISNNKVYVVDKYCKMQPIGIPGELCIAGSNLARGYLNNNHVEDKFVIHTHGEKVYKTGDIVKWLPDGNLYFIGRKDQQIKIRGYRIDILEIENLLLNYEGINHAKVIVKKDNLGEKTLHAYIEAKTNIDPYEAKFYLENNLPKYMVPDKIIQVNKIPLNSNGKIDIKKLNSIDYESITNVSKQKNYDVVNLRIQGIWQEILSIDEINVEDNFFSIGGNSLKVISMIMSIKKSLGIDVHPKIIFEYPTIEKLSNYINELVKNRSYFKLFLCLHCILFKERNML